MVELPRQACGELPIDEGDDRMHGPMKRWGARFAVVLSLVLHCAAIYVPILQQAFSTMPLRASDWLVCTGVASSVVWLRELSKLLPSRGEQRPN